MGIPWPQPPTCSGHPQRTQSQPTSRMKRSSGSRGGSAARCLCEPGPAASKRRAKALPVSSTCCKTARHWRRQSAHRRQCQGTACAYDAVRGGKGRVLGAARWQCRAAVQAAAVHDTGRAAKEHCTHMAQGALRRRHASLPHIVLAPEKLPPLVVLPRRRPASHGARTEPAPAAECQRSRRGAGRPRSHGARLARHQKAWSRRAPAPSAGAVAARCESCVSITASTQRSSQPSSSRRILELTAHLHDETA